MPTFPAPPHTGRLRAVRPDLVTLERGTVLWRIYFAGGTHPTSWDAFRFHGPTNAARFDHHKPPRGPGPRGILYAARRWPTCFGEVFRETRTVHRTRQAPTLAAFELTRRVTLLDLRFAWPTRAGCSPAIGSGPRGRAREWSRCIYAAYPHIEGLCYFSSMDGGNDSIALYERARDALPARPLFNHAVSDVAMIARARAAAQRFGFGLV